MRTCKLRCCSRPAEPGPKLGGAARPGAGALPPSAGNSWSGAASREPSQLCASASAAAAARRSAAVAAAWGGLPPRGTGRAAEGRWPLPVVASSESPTSMLQPGPEPGPGAEAAEAEPFEPEEGLATSACRAAVSTSGSGLRGGGEEQAGRGMLELQWCNGKQSRGGFLFGSAGRAAGRAGHGETAGRQGDDFGRSCWASPALVRQGSSRGLECASPARVLGQRGRCALRGVPVVREGGHSVGPGPHLQGRGEVGGGPGRVGVMYTGGPG